MPAAAQSASLIQRITSHIEILADGSAEVVETIRLDVDDGDQRSGISRSIETRPVTETGERLALKVRDLVVTRGGEAEIVRRTSEEGRVRLITGDPEVPLTPGRHILEFRYVVKGAVRETETHLEFFWDVTGTDWDLVITSANASVNLPDWADPLATVVRTGLRGARDRDFVVGREEDGRITIRSTKPLVPEEGMRVTIAWPKPKPAKTGE